MRFSTYDFKALGFRGFGFGGPAALNPKPQTLNPMGLGLRVQGLGLLHLGLSLKLGGLRVRGLGFRVWGLGDHRGIFSAPTSRIRARYNLN